MLHAVLIALHAAMATATFGLGCALMAALPSGARSVRFVVYTVTMWLTVLSLVAVVIVDWGELPLIRRITFGALCVLGVYLVARTEQARRRLTRRPEGWRGGIARDVGFVLISLFDGFCIVSAIDLRLPPWIIALVAVLGVVAGVLVIRAVVRRDARTAAADVAR